MKDSGRPPHTPTAESRANVEAMTAYGIPQETICKLTKISEKTLRKHYAFELEVGLAKANAKVGQTIFQIATRPLPPPGQKIDPSQVLAGIFWAKTRGGWKQTVAVEATGKDGAPLNPGEQVVIFQLPDNGRGEGK